MSGGRGLTTFSTKKRRNSRTDGCTPTYISQRWMKMATRAMVLGEVLQLEPVVLQQREEGGQRRHQPDQGVCRKEDEVTRPHVGQ
jgi:hypothetical protein